MAVAVVLLAAGCGGGGSGGGEGGRVSLELRSTEPLRSGAPVRWTLVLHNDRPEPLEVEFPSGQDGDVVLRQGGAERYRWSAEQVFTEVVRPMTIGANESRTFAMEGDLTVPPGEYELEASLAAAVDVPPVKRTVTVEG